MPSKHYQPNSIYQDHAGTLYTIEYKPRIRAYHMTQLQPDGCPIANSGVVFSRWIKELNYIGSLGKGALPRKKRETA